MEPAEGVSCGECDCRVFAPQPTASRRCLHCRHGWFTHANRYVLDSSDLLALDEPSSEEASVDQGVDSELVWRLGSLVLWGTTAIPVRLKILLDRLLASPPLPPTARLTLLEDFGWTDEDLARNYILQDHMGRSLSRWQIADGREEAEMIRFFATHLPGCAFEGLRVVGRLAAEMLGEEPELQPALPKPPNPGPRRLRDFVAAQNDQMDPFIRHYETERNGSQEPEEDDEEDGDSGSPGEPRDETPEKPPSAISGGGIFPPHPLAAFFNPFQLGAARHLKSEAQQVTPPASFRSSDDGGVTPPHGSETPLGGSNPKRKVTCDICLHSYCDKGALKIHKGAKHFGEMHACTIPGCPYLFSSRRSRNRHSANSNPKLHKRDPKKDYTIPPNCRVVSPPAAAAAFERDRQEREALDYAAQQDSPGSDPPTKRRRKNEPKKLSFATAELHQTGPPSPFHDPFVGVATAGGRADEDQPLDFSMSKVEEKTPEALIPEARPNPFLPPVFSGSAAMQNFAKEKNEALLRSLFAARRGPLEEEPRAEEEPEEDEDDYDGGDDNPVPLSTPAPSPPGGNGGVILSPTKTALNSVVDVPIYQNNPRRCTGCQKDFQNHFSVKTHYLNVHLKIQIPCTVPGCNSTFPSKRSRDRHSQNLNLHQKLMAVPVGGGGGYPPSVPSASPAHFPPPPPFAAVKKEEEGAPKGTLDGGFRRLLSPALPFPYQQWLHSLAANPQLLAGYTSQLGALGLLRGGAPPPQLPPPNPFQVQ